ncbi:amino acid permease [Paraflavitalea soli]|uniref:Amino acid permease n=1 Tax=Paraflavitalea soli TaxID=2315862 RepID=A0A3B7MNS8_9BACT|nr:amino acid permease [Paraflavitalea soli]AXY74969.1 amino acid permease [Paraflavitalea soli]
MANSLFRTKKVDSILAEGGDGEHASGLKRVLTVKDLTFFGIAAIIGAGSFSSLGEACFKGGPGVVILFIICGIACGFTAFCYSEFASRIPVAGSAYTYAYASFGELFAWIIGWALVMEYSIGNIYVAFSWSDYFTSLMHRLHIHIPDYLACSYLEAKKAVLNGSSNAELIGAWNTAPMIGSLRIILDLPALIINIFITILVYIGIKESRNFSNAMVILKLAVVALVIIVGAAYINTDNWFPANDAGVQSFMPNGFGGVMAAVSGVFFAYIGFDAVSVLAEESKNPQRDLPRGMSWSLIICTGVYILLALVLTGVLNYRQFEGVGDPLAKIFEVKGVAWMQFLVAICAVIAMTSVLLVFQMGQPRIWMSMSRDGLLPPVFQRIHHKFKTPSFATILTGLVVGIPILFTDKSFVLDFTSIATLFAFVLVCGGVLLLPRREKTPGRFNMPFINGQFIYPVIITAAVTFIGIGTDSGNWLIKGLIPAILVAIYIALPALIGSLRKWFYPIATFIVLGIAYSFAWSYFNSLFNFDFSYDPAYINHEMSFMDLAIPKISLIIFWLTCLVLSVITAFKKYSLIPLMGVTTCLYLLTGMTKSNWAWFLGWLALGLVIYFTYGYKKSKLAKN